LLEGEQRYRQLLDFQLERVDLVIAFDHGLRLVGVSFDERFD